MQFVSREGGKGLVVHVSIFSKISQKPYIYSDISVTSIAMVSIDTVDYI